MAKTALIVKVTAADGRRDDISSALSTMIDHVQTEDGTELYILHEDAGDPNVLWFYELYADQESLVAHSQSEPMKELMGTLGSDLVAAPPELSFVTPTGAKGVSL